MLIEYNENQTWVNSDKPGFQIWNYGVGMTQGMFFPSLSTLTNLFDTQGYSGLLSEPYTPTQIDYVLTEHGGLLHALSLAVHLSTILKLSYSLSFFVGPLLQA